MVGSTQRDITMRISFLLLVLVMSACSTQQVITESTSTPNEELAGVDSLRIMTAKKLVEASFPKDPTQAIQLSKQGQELVHLVDQLLRPAPESWTRDTSLAIASFNAGAEMLTKLSEADSLQALAWLEQAAIKFEEALMADAFDDQARQWLSRVYETLAERFRQSGVLTQQIEVLERLVMWNQDRHDYIALLAAAQEDLQSPSSVMVAGALWERAARIALDDVDLGYSVVYDSTSLFTYYVRASRAFGMADRSGLAMQSLLQAKPWVTTNSDRHLIQADSAWLAWDHGNLPARKRFDDLLTEASIHPFNTITGLTDLLGDVQSTDAQSDVKHQLALVKYASGEEDQAVELMQQLHIEAPHLKSITDDYAIMTYNLSQKLRDQGNLEGALAYLLQCASLDSHLSARAAFDAALLLRNNLDAATNYAHMAEDRRDRLDHDEHTALVQYLAELYRRAGNRERARKYLNQFSDLQAGGSTELYK